MENGNERRELEALRLQARAGRAIQTLENHQKSYAQEISERKKRLRRVMVAIQQQEQIGTLPLRGIECISIAEGDETLIHDPLRGL